MNASNELYTFLASSDLDSLRQAYAENPSQTVKDIMTEFNTSNDCQADVATVQTVLMDILDIPVMVGSTSPVQLFRIPGCSIDSAGFVGDYRPLSIRQADPRTPKFA